MEVIAQLVKHGMLTLLLSAFDDLDLLLIQKEVTLILVKTVKNYGDFEHFLLRWLFRLEIYCKLLIFSHNAQTQLETVIVCCWLHKLLLTRLCFESHIGIVNNHTDTGVVGTATQPVNVILELF